MDEKVLILYKAGCKNKDFLKDIKKADNDKKPGLFADDITKHIFASVYYGWLVGKYKENWYNNL